MIDNFIEIIESNTPLREGTDLFYLDIPLEKSGMWFSDKQNDSKFNGTGAKEFNIYYRGKDKSKTMANIEYFKDAIDNLDVCELDSGLNFKMTVLYQWDFLGKDSEGYFIFANVIKLI